MQKTIIKHAIAAGLWTLAVLPAPAGNPNKIVVDGSTTVGPIAKAFAEFYMRAHPDVNITVSESGSGNGAKSLINGACDVATMSRAMKTEELDAARSKKRDPVQHTVAFDGITVIVHPGNPVRNLAKEQLRDIYTGEIKNWKQLGGPDLKIVVISRDTNSGTYETFQEKVASILEKNLAVVEEALEMDANLADMGKVAAEAPVIAGEDKAVAAFYHKLAE